MAENRKVKIAPAMQGGYGQGVKVGTRSVIQGRSAKNPAQGRVAATRTNNTRKK